MNVLTAPGKRLFLTGDEAVARAALEVGTRVVTGYPGNPSTKTIAALLPIAHHYGMTVEWSVNEKVALEVATGAAWAGKRSLVTMKMSGLNVMADSLLSIAHSGIAGALVIYVVDDVGTYYGMVEQDSRYYAQLATLPLLMPANPEEAYSMTLAAFAVSEQTGAPVMLLSTTAVANTITTMKVGKIEHHIQERPAEFRRNLAKFTKAVPQWCLEQHTDAIRRLNLAGELFRQYADLVFASPSQLDDKKNPLGIIVSGVCYTYLQEIRQSPHLTDIPILKLGLVHPLPQQDLCDFLSRVENVLILEELEPFVETQVLAYVAEAGLSVKVLGKRAGLLPRAGDYSQALVEEVIRRVMEQICSASFASDATPAAIQKKHLLEPLPRTLEFCPGCPHRMTYYALNCAIEQLGYSQDEIITTGDIGCTIIGMNAPQNVCWTEVSMGASIGIAQGFKYAGIERPVLAAMGDGTFYHNGVAGLLNAVQSGVNLTLIILDNSSIAMTGMQPSAGTGQRATGETSLRADIALIVRGCGVTHVQRLNPYNLAQMTMALREAMQQPGVSVIIAEAPCTTRGVLIHEHPVQVDQALCMAGRGCEGTPCYHKVGCPSVLLSVKTGKPHIAIDTATCVACGLCAAACPFDAIKAVTSQEYK